MSCVDVAKQCQCSSPGTCSVTGRIVTTSMHEQCKADGRYRLIMTDCWGKAEPPVQSPVEHNNPRVPLPCIYRSETPIEWASCGCHVFDCELHERCVPWRKPKLRAGVKVCRECPDRRKEYPKSNQLTLAITYWNRPRALKRLIRSIETYLPTTPYIVEDTGGNLSAGRNRLYAKVPTDYLVVMEEDFVVVPDTAKHLGDAVAILNHDERIMGVGGSTMEGPKGRVQWGHNFYQMNPKLWGIKPSKRPIRKVGEIAYRPCDLVLNWGVFRKALYQRVPWDEQFPIHEHKEYFWRASQAGNEFAFYWPLRIEHLRDKLSRPHAEYKRNRFRNFTERVYKKHGFRFHSPV